MPAHAAKASPPDRVRQTNWLVRGNSQTGSVFKKRGPSGLRPTGLSSSYAQAGWHSPAGPKTETGSAHHRSRSNHQGGAVKDRRHLDDRRTRSDWSGNHYHGRRRGHDDWCRCIHHRGRRADHGRGHANKTRMRVTISMPVPPYRGHTHADSSAPTADADTPGNVPGGEGGGGRQGDDNCNGESCLHKVESSGTHAASD